MCVCVCVRARVRAFIAAVAALRHGTKESSFVRARATDEPTKRAPARLHARLSAVSEIPRTCAASVCRRWNSRRMSLAVSDSPDDLEEEAEEEAWSAGC